MRIRTEIDNPSKKNSFFEKLEEPLTKSQEYYRVLFLVSIFCLFISYWFILPAIIFVSLFIRENIRRERQKQENAAFQERLDEIMTQEVRADLIRSGIEILGTPCDINLEYGEVCCFHCDVSLVELRAAASGYVGNSVTFRLKLAPGVYYRASLGSVVSETTYQWKEVDSGSLYVTSTRTIFLGHRKSVSVKHKAALHIAFSDEGFLRIDKASGSPLVVNGCPTIILEAIYDRIFKNFAS